MTESKVARAMLRRSAIKKRYMKLDTVIFVTMLKFPKGKLISVSMIKEKYRRALEDAFPDAQVVF